MTASHVPVLTAEVLRQLRPERGGVFVDCTVGLGGHSRALLEAGATRIIGLDRDSDALTEARLSLSAFADRVDLVHADYRTVEDVLEQRGIQLVDGALADLGVSSMQFDSPGRGFSFQRDEPLDMRMDRAAGATAAHLIPGSTEEEVADTISAYGEYSRIDPATRTFQAFRIWVNRELEGLDRFLEAAARRLRVGARLAVITFHSLEDRIVKHTLRALAHGDAATLKVLTKKPVVADEDEVRQNPRARSAKLRAAEKVA